MIISLVHREVFSHKPFLRDGKRGSFRLKLATKTVSQRDVVEDIARTMGGVAGDVYGGVRGAGTQMKKVAGAHMSWRNVGKCDKEPLVAADDEDAHDSDCSSESAFPIGGRGDGACSSSFVPGP